MVGQVSATALALILVWTLDSMESEAYLVFISSLNPHKNPAWWYYDQPALWKERWGSTTLSACLMLHQWQMGRINARRADSWPAPQPHRHGKESSQFWPLGLDDVMTQAHPHSHTFTLHFHLKVWGTFKKGESEWLLRTLERELRGLCLMEREFQFEKMKKPWMWITITHWWWLHHKVNVLNATELNTLTWLKL